MIINGILFLATAFAFYRMGRECERENITAVEFGKSIFIRIRDAVKG